MEVTHNRSRLEAGGLAQRPPSQELRACQGVPLHIGVSGEPVFRPQAGPPVPESLAQPWLQSWDGTARRLC